MSKLHLYAIFHGNLNFSYIPKDFYPQILNNCYWPLLNVIQEQNVPFGLEMSGYTLETVNSLDPSFVESLAKLWHDGACEFIGSGYTQSIMPLMPSIAGRQNLRHSNNVYKKLLGRHPTLAFVNEQVYSAGLPWIYRQEGYEGLVVNWDSSQVALDQPDLLYQPCSVTDGRGGQMPIIWHCTSAYRELQKYVESETSLEDYMRWLDGHVPDADQRALPVYCSDWEVFDFKPWEPYPDGFPSPQRGDIEKIKQLMGLLKQREDIEIISPKSLLSKYTELPLVTPESSDYPLPYKKQHLHSMTRWSVGGRDAVRLNTQCYQLYQQLFTLEQYASRQLETRDLSEELYDLWHELCFLWNSDFRTFTTEEKFVEFRNRMGAATTRAAVLRQELEPPKLAPGEVLLTNHSASSAKSHTVSFTISDSNILADEQLAYELQINGETVPCQVTGNSVAQSGTRNLTLAAMPSIAASRTEVGTVRATPAPAIRSKVAYSINPQHNLVETPAVSLHLLPEYGGTIDTLTFPQISRDPLICRVPPIALGKSNPTEDLLPGNLNISDWLGRHITDRRATEILYPQNGEACDLFVPVRCHIPTELGGVWKTYRVYLHQPRVDLIVRFQWRDLVPTSFRIGQMILNPASFDRASLFYATTNGGEDVERFPLANQRVRHGEPLNEDVTARCCLGATEGWVAMGDNNIGVGLITQPGSLYSAPMISYAESSDDPDRFHLSVVYSLGEMDETSHILWRGHSTWNLSILGGGNDIVDQTRACGLLTNGGLLASSEFGSTPQSLA